MKELISHDSWLMKLLARLTDVIILHLLFIVSCLPVITIGAAISSSLAVGMKLARKEEGSIVKAYWHHFKGNLKQATLLFLLLGCCLILIGVDVYFLHVVGGAMNILISIALVVFILLTSMIVIYGFAYLTRYVVTLKQLTLNIMYLTIRYPSHTICLLFLNGIIALSVISSPIGLLTGIYLFTFGGFGLLAIVNGWLLQKIFWRLENDNGIVGQRV